MVDDAERRFAARDQQQRGADVFRGGDLVGDGVPDAEARQGRARVLAGRHRRGIRQRQPIAAERGGQRETRARSSA